MHHNSAVWESDKLKKYSETLNYSPTYITVRGTIICRIVAQPMTKDHYENTSIAVLGVPGISDVPAILVGWIISSTECSFESISPGSCRSRRRTTPIAGSGVLVASQYRNRSWSWCLWQTWTHHLCLKRHVVRTTRVSACRPLRSQVVRTTRVCAGWSWAWASLWSSYCQGNQLWQP